MSETIIVALLSLLGSLGGTLGGIASGAHTKECAFSKRGTSTSYQTTQYTPPVITELMRTKINNGLHFVGYLCGHLHQGDILNVKNSLIRYYRAD